jgi:hypothetical protein
MPKEVKNLVNQLKQLERKFHKFDLDVSEYLRKRREIFTVARAQGIDFPVACGLKT